MEHYGYEFLFSRKNHPVKSVDTIDRVVFADTQEITEEVIQHYEKNPDELDLIINKEYFNAWYLGMIFALGLTLTIAARVVQFFFGGSFGEFVNTVVLDVISEVGIAIFGGAIVAYLIEFLNKKQFQSNIKFRRDVKAILDQRKAKAEGK